MSISKGRRKKQNSKGGEGGDRRLSLGKTSKKT